MKKNPEIDVEQIMKHIREEVNLRKKQAVSPDNGPSSIPSRINETNKQLHADPISPLPACPYLAECYLEPDVMTLPYKENYTQNDLLQYHDTDFINNAYAAILQRLPDDAGTQHYLKGLQDGRLSKVEILGRLRYSREGMNMKIPIKNLLFSFLIESSFKTPVLGKLIQILTGVLNLPSTLKSIRVLENTLFVKNKIHNEHIRTLNTQIHILRDHIAETQTIIGGSLSLKATNKKVSELVTNSNAKFKTLNAQISLIRNTLELGPEPEAELKPDLEPDLDPIYAAFEDQFRGSRSEIMKRQAVYLPYIEKVIKETGEGEIIDLGCGRGEWLELLKDRGYTAKGVDLNRDMTSRSQTASLKFIFSDVIEYLQQTASDSVPAITGFHIIEHLTFEKMVALINESYRVLKPGGLMILETPNPENLVVGACNFYLDPTHKRPIPPNLLNFLAKAGAFTKIETLRLHPDEHLSQQLNSTTTDKALTSFFAKEQDYAIIARKQ